jgi:hypothetical protein
MLVVPPHPYAGSFGILLVTSTFGARRDPARRQRLAAGRDLPVGTLVNVTPENRRDQTRVLNGGPAQAGTAIAGVVQLVDRRR